MIAKDFPFYECVDKANELIAKGAQVFQKFTCDRCGNRLTIDEPNTFHKIGTCDKCHSTTDIEARGCNYLVVMRHPAAHQPRQ